MDPFILFGVQFTLSLVAYALIAGWYLEPRLSRMPRALALVPLLWVHAFRVVGGTILAPGAVDPGVPMEFRTMVGIGDIVTGFLALLALVALRLGVRPAIALVWVCLVVGTLDTLNAIVQSLRFDVFTYPLGRELGDRHELRPGAAGQQPADPAAPPPAGGEPTQPAASSLIRPEAPTAPRSGRSAPGSVKTVIRAIPTVDHVEKEHRVGRTTGSSAAPE